MQRKGKEGGNSSSTFETHSTDGRDRRLTQVGSSSGAAARMAGGRGCQEQEKQQDGTKGAWDGAAANGGEAERGEGRGARESWLQRKRKEGATAAAAPLRRTALTAESGG